MHPTTSHPHPHSSPGLLGDIATRPIPVASWFIFLSLVLTLHNKWVLDNVVASSNFLLVAQNALSIAVLLVLRQLGRTEKFELNVLRADRREVLCALSQAIQVVTGLGALAFLNVVVHGFLKRLTCVCSWCIELMYTDKTYGKTCRVAPALAVMIFGAAVAGYNDLDFSLPGYALAISSCVAQGAMFELGKRLIVAEEKNNNNEDEDESVTKKPAGGGFAAVLYANSVATLVVALFLFFGMSSGSSSSLRKDGSTGEFIFQVFLNALLALLMNHAVFKNCVVSSPLSHAVSGNVKAAAQTALGPLILAAPALTGLGWFGVACNVLGAAFYSYLRMN